MATLRVSTTAKAMRSDGVRSLRVARRPERAILAIVGLLLMLVAIAPIVVDRDPLAVNPDAALGPPSRVFPFGTDELGRDIFSRALFGLRTTTFTAVSSVLLAGVLGAPAGLWAGYARGAGSTIVMRFFDTLLAVPSIILAIALVAFLGTSFVNLIVAVGIASLPQFGRMAYATTLEQREKEYVQASVALGASPYRVMFRSVLPNVSPYLVIQFALSAAGAAILEAALGFLGLGTQPPFPSLGQMLFTSQRYLYEAPWYGLFPGLALTLLVISMNAMADMLRRAIGRGV